MRLVDARLTEMDRRIAELRKAREELRRLARRSEETGAACSPGQICRIINPG